MNLPNWTGGEGHGVKVAIEVKHLMGALGGPQEFLGAPKDPLSGFVVVVVFVVLVVVVVVVLVVVVCVFYRNFPLR